MHTHIHTHQHTSAPATHRPCHTRPSLHNIRARLAACVLLHLLVAGFFATASAQTQTAAPDLAALRQKAAQGDAAAQNRLGRLLCNLEPNASVTCDYAEGVKWLQKAAAKNDAAGQNSLGRAYLAGVGVEKDEARAVKYFKLAAKQGLPKALSNLAMMYQTGRGGLRKDTDESARLYKEAFQKFQAGAESGDAFAQCNLGTLYAGGLGVRRSRSAASEWWHKAAAQGHAEAQCNIGTMYRYGLGVGVDGAEAVKWYRMAAEQGLALAQNSLGAMYENGKLVAKDMAESLKWYRMAAERGDAYSQNTIANMYENGQGAARDVAEAAKWYRLAAEQGHVKAQYRLGQMYETGEGVPKSISTAVKWYRKAAAQGLPGFDAKQALARLGK